MRWIWAFLVLVITLSLQPLLVELNRPLRDHCWLSAAVSRISTPLTPVVLTSPLPEGEWAGVRGAASLVEPVETRRQSQPTTPLLTLAQVPVGDSSQDRPFTLSLPLIQYRLHRGSLFSWQELYGSYARLPGEKPPGWIWQPAGPVTIPVLLYHRVVGAAEGDRYRLPVKQFESQMLHLRAAGYTSVSVALLVEALENGAYMPARPVVISFDDGYREVLTQALPVMKRFGFTGIVYMIASHTEIGGYLHPADLKTLLEAGWEVGSHSATHASLRKPGVDLESEITSSRLALQEMLDTSITSFSFPFGLTTPYATQLVKDSGYLDAVGLGGQLRNTPNTRYYLSRIEVHGDSSLEAFSHLLPWNDSPTRRPRRGEIEP